jgi:hypothetical protein
MSAVDRQTEAPDRAGGGGRRNYVPGLPCARHQTSRAQYWWQQLGNATEPHPTRVEIADVIAKNEDALLHVIKLPSSVT